MYRIHQGKLDHILNSSYNKEHQAFRPIKTYLTDMAENCPHRLFQDSGNTGSRASAGKSAFTLDAVKIKTKRNHACRMADLALQTVTNNKRRHDEIQRFMLINDSVTVAVEVPIILTPEDIAHMQRTLGFEIPTDTALTGHIDVLQIRNGKVHILDYKPGATKEKPIAQLMVYALALSRPTGLRLYDFVCTWFDEHHYFEFYPLHVVHKRGENDARAQSATGRVNGFGKEWLGWATLTKSAQIRPGSRSRCPHRPGRGSNACYPLPGNRRRMPGRIRGSGYPTHRAMR
jgi:PD-(D/E)XK nuclease superfamily